MLSPRNRNRSGFRARSGSHTGCGLAASAQEPKAMRASVRSRAGCGSETEAATGVPKAARVPPRAAALASARDCWRSRRLFIGSSLVLQPARFVLSLRIVVRPVHDAALVVPLIDAMEFDRIADGEALDARREVDVVRDQHGVSRGQFQDETLVPVAEAVVAEGGACRPASGSGGAGPRFR